MHGAQRRLPSRIKQESHNSRRKRVLSASRIKFKDKRSRARARSHTPTHTPRLPSTHHTYSAYSGNARFLLSLSLSLRRCHPPPASHFCSRSNSRSLLFIIPSSSSISSPLAPCTLSSPLTALLVPHSSAGETLREITLNIYLRDDCSRRADGINIIM